MGEEWNGGQFEGGKDISISARDSRACAIVKRGCNFIEPFPG